MKRKNIFNPIINMFMKGFLLILYFNQLNL